MTTQVIRERPILFSGPMVRAILDGRKTQTRRVVKPQPPEGWTMQFPGPLSVAARHVRWEADGLTEQRWGDPIRCPYGVPGDRLWVREALWVSECGRYYAQHLGGTNYDVLDKKTHKRWRDRRYVPTGFNDEDKRFTHPEFDAMVVSWSLEPKGFDLGFSDHDTSLRIIPGLGNTILTSYDAQFRRRIPSIHMPRWACRIILEVVGVRVERVQEISRADAKAEGFVPGRNGLEQACGRSWGNAQLAFHALWDSLNAKRGFGWETDPWVWAVEFKKLENTP